MTDSLVERGASPRLTDAVLAARLFARLRFDPVRLRARRDGWTVERQRRYVAALARTGSGRFAAAAVGLSEQSAGRLRRRPDAASFTAACEAAWQLGRMFRQGRIFSPREASTTETSETSAPPGTDTIVTRSARARHRADTLSRHLAPGARASARKGRR